MNPLTNQATDPLRPADWRWQLALDLAEDAKGSFRRCGDPAVKSAKRFWRLWGGCRGEADRRVLAARMPTVYHAFLVYAGPHGVTRSALEARVLAGETPEAIAAKSATSAAVVAAYEVLFYDVRGRLKSPDYILNRVIGSRLRDGTADWGYDLVWKFFGYVGGPFVLDQIMDTCSAAARPATTLEVAAFLSGDARAAFRRQLAVAARVLRAGERDTAGAFVQANARLVSGRGEEEDTPNALARHIDAMLKEMPWATGDDAEENLPPALAEYDKATAELRDDEVWRVARGEEPAGLAGVKELKIPPPEPRAGPPGQ